MDQEDSLNPALLQYHLFDILQALLHHTSIHTITPLLSTLPSICILIPTMPVDFLQMGFRRMHFVHLHLEVRNFLYVYSRLQMSVCVVLKQISTPHISAQFSWMNQDSELYSSHFVGQEMLHVYQGSPTLSSGIM